MSKLLKQGESTGCVSVVMVWRYGGDSRQKYEGLVAATKVGCWQGGQWWCGVFLYVRRFMVRGRATVQMESDMKKKKCLQK